MTCPQVVRAPEVLLWDHEQEVRWLPEFHVRETLSSLSESQGLTWAAEQDTDTMRAFQKALHSAEAAYVDGVPLHIADPARSMIRVMSRKEVIDTETERLQAIFRNQHILVVDYVDKEECFSWSIRDLQRVTDWNKDVEVHGGWCLLSNRLSETNGYHEDNSLPQTDSVDARTLPGTMEQVYEHSKYRHAAHILNVLDLPNVTGPAATPALASEMVCWQKVHGTAGNTSKEEHFPMEHTRWSLVALRRALHRWHVDAEGLATWIQTMCGHKLWFLARRRDAGGFSTRQFYETFDIGEPDKDDWIVEVVVLKPGTRL